MEQSGGCFQKCLHPNCDGAASSSSMSLGNTTLNHFRYNDTQQEMKSTEDFLASELSKLSVQERSKALDDLHCVGEDLTETSELIETSLREMDRILKERNDPIYNTAARQNQSYVEDPTFRLRFLRANNHDARKSANQMLGLLSRKEKYFGRDRLARDITLDDLNKEDMDLLLSGFVHIQDGTDRNGRLVVFFLPVRLDIYEVKAEVMRKGIVVCCYDMRPGKLSPVLTKLEDYVKFVDFLPMIPIRRSAVHFCLQDISGSLVSYNIILGRMLQRFQRSEVARVRVHYGSDIELQYKLRSHGFHPKTIPVDTSGNIRRDIQNVWFQKYVTNEWGRIFAYASHMPLSAVAKQHSSTSEDHHENAKGNSSDSKNSNGQDVTLDSKNTNGQDVTLDRGHRALPPTATGTERDKGKGNQAKTLRITPTDNDILLGRGRYAQNNLGNIHFRELVETRRTEYDMARKKRGEMRKVITEIRRIVASRGVRFLKQVEKDLWVESTSKEIETKIAQLFREFRKQK